LAITTVKVPSAVRTIPTGMPSVGAAIGGQPTHRVVATRIATTLLRSINCQRPVCVYFCSAVLVAKINPCRTQNLVTRHSGDVVVGIGQPSSARPTVAASALEINAAQKPTKQWPPAKNKKTGARR